MHGSMKECDNHEHALPLLREGVSRSGGDLPDTGKVTKSAGNGACGEAVTPRCASRLSMGRLRNTNLLTRI
jgi:hypothetical protein